MNYLAKDDIIIINQRTVQLHGGNFVPPFNLLNENPLYPEIDDKTDIVYLVENF